MSVRYVGERQQTHKLGISLHMHLHSVQPGNQIFSKGWHRATASLCALP